MSELRALIFDWDGTLCDSVSRIVQAMHAAADLVGLPRCSDSDIRNIVGLGLPEAIAALYPDVKQRHADALRNAYSDCYIGLEEVPSPLFAGVIEALKAFRHAGFKLAVATGKSRRGLQRVLAAHDLEGFFDSTRCADETASKPDPLMLRLILAELQVEPAQSLMLGDSEFDLRMARAASVRPVAVSYGAQSREHLLRWKPERCIDDFNEFFGWVMPQLGGQSVTEA